MPGGFHPNTRAWTAEEDLIILQLITRFGSQWKEIAKGLHSRSVNSIRNRYQRLQGKHVDYRRGVIGKQRCTACGLIRVGHICLKKLKVPVSQAELDLMPFLPLAPPPPSPVSLATPPESPVTAAMEDKNEDDNEDKEDDDKDNGKDDGNDDALEAALYKLEAHLMKHGSADAAATTTTEEEEDALVASAPSSPAAPIGEYDLDLWQDLKQWEWDAVETEVPALTTELVRQESVSKLPFHCVKLSLSLPDGVMDASFV